METVYITVRYVTYGQRAQRILEEMGISCVLSRARRWMEAQGCGYALKVRTEDVDGVLGYLDGIPWKGVYKEGER